MPWVKDKDYFTHIPKEVHEFNYPMKNIKVSLVERFCHLNILNMSITTGTSIIRSLSIAYILNMETMVPGADVNVRLDFVTALHLSPTATTITIPKTNPF